MYCTRRFVGLMVLAAVAMGCQSVAETAEQVATRTAEEAAAARTAIEAANAGMAAHMNAEHWDSAAMVYAEGARAMPPNAVADVGRPAVLKSLQGMAGLKVNISFATRDVAVNGPIAIESGTYTITLTPPGAPGPMTDTGKYMAHWHLTGDGWRIVENIWNTDVPAPPAPPPAR